LKTEAGNFIPRFVPIVVLGCLILSPACVRRSPKLVPPPSVVETVSGFGSISLRQEGGGTAKARFSFFFDRPDRGRIEVFGPFGKTISIMLFKAGRARFLLPSRKVYWEGPEETPLGRFLGCGWTVDEWIGLLGGQGPDSGGREASWALERDPSGRVLGGLKEASRFDIVEFFPPATVPRIIVLSRPGWKSRIRILKIAFNAPARDAVLEPSEPEGYGLKTWEEIEAMIEDEN
jgi:hypothetical protein